MDIEPQDLRIVADDLEALAGLGEASWKTKAVLDAADAVARDALRCAEWIGERRAPLLADAPTLKAKLDDPHWGWSRWRPGTCDKVADELRTIAATWDDDDVDDYVTMDQAAAMVRRSRSWIEHRRDQLPEPDRGGGRGREVSWAWSRLRPELERLAGLRPGALPAKFPGGRILPPLEQ